ncbi:MAG: hypothetical protein ACYCZO_02870 [Daejeonella sp.]
MNKRKPGSDHLKRHSYTPLSEERFKEILALIAKLRKGEISEEDFDKLLTDEEYRNAMMMAQLRDYN